MTIKELEALSGMERATIRFYEHERLIEPRRLDNGYRDYSEYDLHILLRVKLLRSLHFSLDEIYALKTGCSELGDVLARQMEKLEQERQDISYAQDICRVMREEKATFATLDAVKYLEDIDRAAEKTSSLYFEVKGDRLPQVFRPWRRFLARSFDIFLYRILWETFLSVVFHVNLTDRTTLGNLLDSFMAVAIMLVIEPLWLCLFATTPGKAIFGLRIENEDGRKFSYSEGSKRTWAVVGAGLGYNIPIYNIVRLWKSYKTCSENQPQSWDEFTSYSMKDAKLYRSMLYVGACMAAFTALLMVHSAQMLPPNRGSLTVEQFAENYNYYASYLDMGLEDAYLNADGAWAERQWDGVVSLEVGYREKPEYHFDVENGHVKGVSFQIEIENNQEWLGSYDTEMLLASLAFVGAQSEMGLFSEIPSRISKQISNNPFQDFSSEEAGVAVSCDVEYSGYDAAQFGFLWPEGETAETYFRLTYSMSIIS